jgi:NADH-quinone oxidoreductase subunit N
MDAIVFPPVLIGPLMPTLVVLAAAALVLLLDLVPRALPREVAAMVALAGMVGALLATLARWSTPGRAFRDMVVLDNFALFFNVIICYAGALIVLLSMDYLRRTGSESAEYWALVLFATAGMMLLAAAGDLIVVFLALELMSLSLYVLAGLFKRDLSSGEAAMKYFLLGAFASSFLLYGIALIYGATGTTNLDRIAAAVASRPRDPLFVIGLGLLMVGFGFKISSVPFTCGARRAPGAPTSVTAPIATGSKPAPRGLDPRADGDLARCPARLVSAALGDRGRHDDGRQRVALAQRTSLMLAYSSIAHVGYMLVGLVAGGAAAPAGALLSPDPYLHDRRGLRIITPGERAAKRSRWPTTPGSRGGTRCWRRRSGSFFSPWSGFLRWPASSGSSTSSAPPCAQAISGWRSSAC